jgi:hypothetical protein
MEKIKLSFVAIVILLSFMACKKESSPNTAAADVYVKAILVHGVPVFGLTEYVVGSNLMNSVSVLTPDGLTSNLNSYDTSGMTFYKEPVDSTLDYSTVPPAAGVYNFSVTFGNGEQQVISNILGASYLLPPTITSIVESTDGQTVTMNWNPIVADYFQLSISKGGTVVYASQAFTAPITNSLAIPIGLIPSFSAGVYTYELDAIQYESASSNLIQAVSSASVTITLQ